ILTPVMTNHCYPMVMAGCWWWRDIGKHLLEISFPKPIRSNFGESSETLFTGTTCLPTLGHFIRHGVELSGQGGCLARGQDTKCVHTCLMRAIGKTLGGQANTAQGG